VFSDEIYLFSSCSITYDNVHLENRRIAFANSDGGRKLYIEFSISRTRGTEPAFQQATVSIQRESRFLRPSGYLLVLFPPDRRLLIADGYQFATPNTVRGGPNSFLRKYIYFQFVQSLTPASPSKIVESRSRNPMVAAYCI
jgi:hypothetical protein